MIAKIFALCLVVCAALSARAADPSAVVPYAKLEWRDEVYFWQGKPFTGLAKDQHKNGKPKGEYPFKDGRLHGLVREWWDNGQLSTETNFDNGQRHGLNRYWSQKGELMKEQVYDHDKSVSEKHFDVK